MLLAAIPSAVPNKKWELFDKKKTENQSFYFIFLCFSKTPRDWLVTGEANVQRKQPQLQLLPFSQPPREDNAAIS